MRLVAMSDSHGQHRSVTLPEGDVLVHAGDLCKYGQFKEVRDFGNWLAVQPHAHKLVVPGNHDKPFETRLADCRHYLQERGVTLLLDEEVRVEGFKFYGSPWTPTFLNWHFMKNRGEQIQRVWAAIPDDTDVLITHGPPYGHGDLAPPFRGGLPRVVGCADLLARVAKVTPRLHVFGHIHGGHGASGSDHIAGTRFINASVCTEAYHPTNQPFVVDLSV